MKAALGRLANSRQGQRVKALRVNGEQHGEENEEHKNVFPLCSSDFHYLKDLLPSQLLEISP